MSRRLVSIRFATALIASVLGTGSFGESLAATKQVHPPAGALPRAPLQYSEFTDAELMRGFLALAFGSDMRISGGRQLLRKFDHPVRVLIRPDLPTHRERLHVVLNEFALATKLAIAFAESVEAADVVVHLVK